MTGSIVGTPHYMSPEQVQGQPVDGRSDQFSLAVIAYEMLTDEKPYTGEHLTTVVYKIMAQELPPPRRKSQSEPTVTTTTEFKRKSGFLGFLLAVLAVAGLLALIGWQAAPW